IYWGYIFEGIKGRYVLVEDNYLIFASSENAMRNFIRDYVHGSFVRDSEWYRNLKNKLAGKYNLSYFAKTAEMLPQYEHLTTEKARQLMEDRRGQSPVFPSWALQWSNEGGMLYNTLFLNPEAVQNEVQAHVLWQTRLEGRMGMKPVPVINHVTDEREVFVQDDKNAVYLINDAGRVLWRVPVDGKINSEVWQVDLFKNGKLQYLFSTPTRMYLIDRNGNAAGCFPLTFRTRCEQGISVFDYDNNKNYRIFAPCGDREIYLYGLDGKLIQGWKPDKADKPIVSKVRHFRVDGKDYIVFADQYRLYILDRKGRERVKISSVFDLPGQTDIYTVRRKGRQWLVFAGNGGKVHLVDFEGNVETFDVAGLGHDFRMNVADIDGDGMEDCIFADKNRLLIVRTDGKIVSEKEMEAESLDYPYVYRFSGTDYRIGLTDTI
ncbi:MAG: WD40 repeat domain-containing protein, partial [Odoribacter sp.]|nr:WD40 repeat domain-containing protein [Odoribacter sp.]